MPIQLKERAFSVYPVTTVGRRVMVRPPGVYQVFIDITIVIGDAESLILKSSSSHPLPRRHGVSISNWCPGPDLNRHDRNDRGILSPLCLPISPPGQSADLAGATDTMQAENPKREPTK